MTECPRRQDHSRITSEDRTLQDYGKPLECTTPLDSVSPRHGLHRRAQNSLESHLGGRLGLHAYRVPRLHKEEQSPSRRAESRVRNGRHAAASQARSTVQLLGSAYASETPSRTHGQRAWHSPIALRPAEPGYQHLLGREAFSIFVPLSGIRHVSVVIRQSYKPRKLHSPFSSSSPTSHSVLLASLKIGYSYPAPTGNTPNDVNDAHPSGSSVINANAAFLCLALTLQLPAGNHRSRFT